MVYIQSIDYNIWEVIEFCPCVPTKIIKVDGKLDQIISKPREVYNKEDNKNYL